MRKVKKMHITKTKEKGNIEELISTCLCLIMITVLVMAYLENVNILQQKAKINQIARKYILRMETEGYLTDAEESNLHNELTLIGAKELSFDGTTFSEVCYGQEIYLVIKGKIGDEYSFSEVKTSTAKN